MVDFARFARRSIAALPGSGAAPAPLYSVDPPRKRQPSPLDELIDSLVPGERITVYAHAADGWHHTGTFIGTSEDLGQRWLDLQEADGWPMLSLPRACIAKIERE